MTDAMPPGWYPDSEKDGWERWWDGRSWTQHSRDGSEVDGSAQVELSDRRQERAVLRQQRELIRQQKVVQRRAEQEREEVVREARRFAQTPVGRARAAFEHGDGFFQLELQVSELTGGASSFGSASNQVRTGGRPDLLGQIEEEGFKLEHVGYVFTETGATSTNRVLSTGQGTVTRGFVQGIYLFRRALES